MKEHPLQLNSSAVRSVLAGIKTQVRFPIRSQPAAAMEMLNIDFSPRGDFFLSKRSDPYRGSAGKFCPFGRAGDLLWIREAHNFGGLPPSREAIKYRADAELEEAKWLPPNKMPRWASRILLKIAEVHVERIQEIRNADAVAEGYPVEDQCQCSPIAAFALKWESTYKKHQKYSWSANPWVWVIMFHRVEQTIVCPLSAESGLRKEL
jgi:hypothetical protein